MIKFLDSTLNTIFEQPLEQKSLLKKPSQEIGDNETFSIRQLPLSFEPFDPNKQLIFIIQPTRKFTSKYKFSFSLSPFRKF